MPERTATTVSFFFLSATTLRLVSSAISSHCLLASLSFIPLFCSPAFSYGGEKRWSQGYSFSIGAMQNRDVCKQTKRSSASRRTARLQADETFVCKRPKRADEKVRDVRVCLERFAGKVKQHTLIKDNPERREK